ncbi:MAG: BTAD domain-containing putative transcriptional regulator, partial [Candidatus Promineifilaceae bacterium]|nr:BTAD domain-containing putative transcriptional regulator [Candidatus Promineifilaceae bacterium]
MPKLSLFLLGSPRVKLDEADIEVKPRKAFALLIFLAVTAETLTRDFLATLLWPASDQRRARRALRNRLSELKQTLGGSWIEAGRETIGLRSGCWLDTAEFQRLSAAEHADPERLLEAVDLYRDDFLAGFTLPDCPAYDEWQYFQSESLRGDLAAALDRLVETLSDRGDYETAVPHARRRLALDPLHEPACRQLMRLYARAGQQSAALRQYDLCRQALAEELGVEPQEETMDLYDQIQTGSFVRQVRPRHNLPVQTTTFIGREVELAAIERLLLDEEEYRLLTLVGPGGTGKTRLALAAAAEAHDHFPDGVYFVSLATANDAAQVPKVIAETFGIIEKPHEPLAETLQEYFRHQQMLLILDNFEHVLDAASLVNALLQVAPHLTILTSSREALRLSGEQEYQVPPLALPEPGQIEALPDLLEVESIALFVNRTRASSSNFELTAENAGAVAGICRRLDGLPLAIELAAARIKLFTPRQLLQRLQNRLGLLVAGPRDLPDRQRTLRDTIDWSYHLLEEMEKQLFARLAVFSGGCTVEAVEVICDFEPVGDPLSALGSLLDKSLLYQRVGPAGEPRFYMLETIGEYARERLKQREEEEPLRRRHAEYYVALAETAEPQLRLADQALWMDRLESEHDNLRGALSWLLAQDPISGLRLGAAIGHFWHVRAHHSEGRVWLAKFLEITDSDR